LQIAISFADIRDTATLRVFRITTQAGPAARSDRLVQIKVKSTAGEYFPAC